LVKKVWRALHCAPFVFWLRAALRAFSQSGLRLRKLSTYTCVRGYIYDRMEYSVEEELVLLLEDELALS
jgi:hypothetical protein